MAERIYITYSNATGIPYVGTTLGYHKAIHYVDSSGNHRVIEGFPENKFNSTVSKSAALIKEELFSNGTNSDSPFGKLQSVERNATPKDGTFPQETLIEGDDLSGYWEDLRDARNQVDQESYEYRPDSQNSNSYIDEIMRRAGLPSATEVGDNGLPYNAPGSDIPLSNPGAPGGIGNWAPPWIPLPPWIPMINNPFFFPPVSPLILDLDGDGIELISLEDSQVHFDLDNDGFAQRTGWVAPDDGMLAHDVNGNGQIDNNSELFGSETTDGFTILAQHDLNDDGRLDATDQVWNDLRIWVDADQNGQSTASELKSLEEWDITEIDLSALEVEQAIQGHDVSHVSTYETSGSVSRAIVDVWYENDPIDAHWILPAEFEFHEEALKLPELKGWGSVTDLSYRMSVDSAFRNQVKELVVDAPTKSARELREDFEQILLTWAGALTVDPSSREVVPESRTGV